MKLRLNRTGLSNALQFKYVLMLVEMSSKKGGRRSAWLLSEFKLSHHKHRAWGRPASSPRQHNPHPPISPKSIVTERHGLAIPSSALVEKRPLLPFACTAADECRAIAERAPGARGLAGAEAAKPHTAVRKLHRRIHGAPVIAMTAPLQIGRASCRERYHQCRSRWSPYH